MRLQHAVNSAGLEPVDPRSLIDGRIGGDRDDHGPENRNFHAVESASGSSHETRLKGAPNRGERRWDGMTQEVARGVVLGLLTSVPFAVSCASATEVGPLDPRPARWSVPPGSVRLLIGKGVADGFRIDAGGRRPAIRVRAWRATLANGFHRAFGIDETTGGSTARVLRLERAELTLVSAPYAEEASRRPPIILVHGGPHVPKTVAPPRGHILAAITYVATLSEGSGLSRGRSEGTARSALPAGRDVSLGDAIDSAIEAMLEGIGADLFGRPAARQTSGMIHSGVTTGSQIRCRSFGADSVSSLASSGALRSRCKVADPPFRLRGLERHPQLRVGSLVLLLPQRDGLGELSHEEAHERDPALCGGPQ